MTAKLVDLVGKVKTGAAAKRVCLALAKHYGATIKYGRGEPLIGVFGAALNALGIKNKTQFVNHCAITVGDAIYLPFKPGDSQPPWRQVATVAHECRHVQQGADDHLLFWLRYFTSKAHRTEFETSALSVDMEVIYRLKGYLCDPYAFAEILAWYNVRSKDIAVCAKHLAIVKNTLQRGGEVSEQIRVIAKALA